MKLFKKPADKAPELKYHYHYEVVRLTWGEEPNNYGVREYTIYHGSRLYMECLSKDEAKKYAAYFNAHYAAGNEYDY